MINKAMNFLVDELNQYIARRTETDDQYVKLTRFGDGTADESPIANGTLGCCVINIEEEKVGKAQLPYTVNQSGSIGMINPPIRLNLTIVFAADPGSDKYNEALRLISYTVAFFQGKNEFTPDNSPALDPELKMLRVELLSIPLEQLNYLWGAMSAAYIPSVVYLVRLISIQDDNILRAAPVITTVRLDIPTQ